MVPLAVEKNGESPATLLVVKKLVNLRIPLRAPLSAFDLMVESTVAGVKEESRVRRYAA